jgi:hypothetical protein
MKVLLAFLFLGLTAFAGEPSNHEQSKPAAIQDGSAAQSYISKALYEYLDKPPYLTIDSATPFLSKIIEGKTMWLALVDFHCGVSEQDKLHCITVIVYDPVTNTHRFVNPDDFEQASDRDTI